MASARDRIILLPRFTTLAGEATFTTQGMNVSAYESADITIWMGRIVGDGTLTATIQESTDGVVWSVCAGSSSKAFSQLAEELLTPTFSKAWMRLEVVSVPGPDDPPTATVWVAGTANKRRK